MTILQGRSGTALLVVDMQVGVVAAAHDRDAVIATIVRLVARARDGSVPVVWIQHHDEHLTMGSDAWRLVPELVAAPAEPVIEKSYGDAFEDTKLEEVLSDLDVGELFVTGAQTDACIRSTLHGALVRGYDTVLVADAHTTEDLTHWGAPPPEQVIAHTNLYWSNQTAPHRRAGTANAADIALQTVPRRTG
jgi:nicotinamidase-related amidase